MMSKEAMKLALETSEGIVNADWRKWDELASPSEFERWAKSRANFMATILREALAEQPAQPKYRRGDRLICLETEEYCVIHISGTDRQWVKFPDTHIGVYKNEQLAELFELLPKEIELEQPAQQKPVAWMCYPFGDDEVEFGPYEECENCIPLYTSPPAQRTWVGLTDEEVDEWTPEIHSVIRAIEAKLREKNT